MDRLTVDVLKFKPSVSQGSQATLADAFQKAHVYINHVVRLGETGLARAHILWRVVARGGLIILPENNSGMETICLICMDDQVNMDSTTYLIIQIRRDQSMTLSSASSLFSAMDPDWIGLVSEGQSLKHPLIRLVMNFKATAGIHQCFTGDNSMAASGHFTSYDIWCGGLSKTVYRCVLEDEETWYLDALRKCDPLSKLYSDMTVEEIQVLQSQLPAFGDEEGHWSWVDFRAADELRM